ncbi:murein hydrolase activator EnvC family protein [Hansschlegelia plantiphila]|uniref:Membrane protein n=1 Tax=Hansschlegelia plantiphila TaxID=374655 RepID=A0A9W6J5K0_9HYPH|nr:peptidoglycan DD-metalloendopeptidase family protein [Hansschlegelia plantiphila]GLK69809.1 membrane protein [Hansschlegelia plantiphila]
MRASLRTLLLCLALAGAAAARAEEAAPAPDPAAEQRKALEIARENLKATQERRERLAAEIEALKGERGKLQTALIDTAAALREKEPAVQDREKRIADLAESERQLKASLVARRGVLADVIAALQRMGRQPPPALLVRPNDALEAIRSAILLGAVVPDMRAEAEALASDLREMARLKGMLTGERDALAHEMEGLGAERERLTALVDERQRQLGQQQAELTSEGDKAGLIARNVGDLETLISKMEQQQARAAADAAKQAPPPDQSGKVDMAALHDAARLAPAIPFEKARGMLSMPVSGNRVLDFGQTNGAGLAEQGISIAASPGATVTAPCDSWVVYAGPFRSYRQVLILNAGGGYYVVLAGMERINVALNQFVLAGEPVAAMQGGAAASGDAGSPSASARPVLYVEFRKDRGSIDPSPWWAGTSGEKAGG